MLYVIICVAVLGAILMIRGFCEQYMLEINEINIDVHKTTGNKVSRNILDVDNVLSEKVIYFADFHNIKNEKYVERVIDNIIKVDSNKIFIGGDLIIGKKGYDNKYAIAFLEKLLEYDKFDIYFTYGNHESRLVERKIEEQYYLYNYFEMLEKQNKRFHLVNNKTIELNIVNNTINLSGILFEEDYYFGRLKPSKSIIEEKVGIKKEGFTIVICHKPDFLEYLAEYKADLILAGHNHGGIVRLPVVGGLISTSGRPFPKYSAGIYKKGDTEMILTKGLGTHTIKFRLFNKPEIVILNFK